MESAEHQVIDVDTSDALEMGPVEAGEYKVQILKAVFKSGEGSQGPWKGISLTLDIPDEVAANIFNDMVWLPIQDSQEAKTYERNKSAFDKFKRSLGFGPTDAFTTDDLVGRTGWAYLIIKSDDEYGDQNRVSKWIAGPSEQAGVQY